MRSVKDLQKAADLERQKAEAERQAAKTHRDTASDFSVKDDPQLPIDETHEAQLADERAQLHDEQATTFAKQANDLQKEAVRIEGLKQQKQEAMQNELDQLDAQAKALRGE